MSKEDEIIDYVLSGWQQIRDERKKFIVSRLLMASFIWGESQEGDNYWKQVYNNLRNSREETQETSDMSLLTIESIDKLCDKWLTIKNTSNDADYREFQYNIALQKYRVIDKNQKILIQTHYIKDAIDVYNREKQKREKENEIQIIEKQLKDGGLKCDNVKTIAEDLHHKGYRS